MDLRVKKVLPIRRISPEDGMRALAGRVTEAEALAVSWFEPLRPLTLQVYALRRRIGTAIVAICTVLLFVHVMFGANGMVVYKQKRSEYETLQAKIRKVREENETYAHTIQGLKTDEKAIEKEAREQLRYARPGEFVYVPPSSATSDAPLSNAAKN